jgi:CubicO group peptidase (beta-lactamase class C family)
LSEIASLGRGASSGVIANPGLPYRVKFDLSWRHPAMASQPAASATPFAGAWLHAGLRNKLGESPVWSFAMAEAMADEKLLIKGSCDAEFAGVRDAFADNFRRRGEVGAAVCVYKNGKKVVDLWGGYKDLAKTEPWDENTIVIMNSVAKSMTSLCMHILIDRGKVDFDAPVADYWPEFAQAGKAGVLIRHILGQNMAAYGHSGTGGAFAWCDCDRNIAFSYCTNYQREGAGIGARGAVLALAAGGGTPPRWLK